MLYTKRKKQHLFSVFLSSVNWSRAGFGWSRWFLRHCGQQMNRIDFSCARNCRRGGRHWRWSRGFERFSIFLNDSTWRWRDGDSDRTDLLTLSHTEIPFKVIFSWNRFVQNRFINSVEERINCRMVRIGRLSYYQRILSGEISWRNTVIIMIWI